MPETQATTLSDRMLPPNHTCTGLSSLRTEAGEQGSRKTAAPATHCVGGDREVTDGRETPPPPPRPRGALAYLEGEEGGGGDADPAVQRVDVGDVFGAVEAEDGAEPDHRQQQRQEHQRRMQQLPAQFGLSPGQRDAVQNRSCRQPQPGSHDCQTGGSSLLAGSRTALTVAVEDQQPRHHQGRVPVELLVRPIPGETTSPPNYPIADAGDAGHAHSQQQQVAQVEAGRHPGWICWLGHKRPQEAQTQHSC